MFSNIVYINIRIGIVYFSTVDLSNSLLKMLLSICCIIMLYLLLPSCSLFVNFRDPRCVVDNEPIKQDDVSNYNCFYGPPICLINVVDTILAASVINIGEFPR